MRTVEEIEYQIKVLEVVKKEWIVKHALHHYLQQWHRDNQKKCDEKIALLQWVLGLKETSNPCSK